MSRITPASWISILRIALAPVFFGLAWEFGKELSHGNQVELIRFLALTVFAVASLSDALDGFVARRWNQVSRLGTALDPVGDKLLHLAAMIVFVVHPWSYEIHFAYALLTVLRDVLIIVGFLILLKVGRVSHLKPSVWSKVTTILQIVLLVWVLLTPPGSRPFAVAFEVYLYMTALATLVSSLVYARVLVRALR